MSEPAKRSGSRYLYEPFDATAAKVDTIEKVNEERWKNLERRLSGIEGMLERLEKRLWIAVYGVVGVILTQAIYSLLTFKP